MAHRNDGLVVLAVNAWNEPAQTVRKFARKQELTHPILLQGMETAETYRCRGVPMNFWIDRGGTVVDVQAGFQSRDALIRRTRQLLHRK